MSTAISSKHSRLQVLNAILCCLMAYIAYLLVTSQTIEYRASIESELKYIKDTVSEDEWETIDNSINRKFQDYLFENGLFDLTKKMFIPIASDSEVNKTFSDEWNYRTVNNFQIFFYQLMYRVTLLQYSIMILGPFMLCLFYSAYNQWRIKQFQLGGQSSRTVRVWFKLIWLGFAAISIYAITPIGSNIFTLITPPAILIAITFAGAQIIKSFDK